MGPASCLTVSDKHPMLVLSERRLYTVKEAVEQLSLGVTKTYELMARGQLESVTIGKARRIPAEALDAFIRKLRAEQVA